ncbi:terminase small subunit [Anaerosporobacter faecicola]|uniref:terminase small subunit n=1 Tax=Anaerosporobacter faecicola TaxID=2718714 RepID=UPI001438A0D5|nr:terminase small subunit [Anaerosporobacter faecicola]
MARSPNEQVQKAHDLYKQGMMLVEIASQLNIPVGTVRSWKKRYKWECNATQEKKRNVAKAKQNNKVKREAFDDGIRETLKNEKLTHEQRLFCVYYAKDHNAVQSYIKAYNTTYQNACSNAHKLLKNTEICKEIDELIELKAKSVHFSSDELIEYHMRIAFADIGNYVEFGRKEIEDKETGIKFEVNDVRLHESDSVDTQLIKEVSKNDKGAVSIKLVDRCDSLKWLEQYFMVNPHDKHKSEYEYKESELRIKKMQLDIANQTGDNNTNEGIMEFLKATKPSQEDINALYADEEEVTYVD